MTADLTPPAQAQSEDERTGRIVARTMKNRSTEFGWQPTGGERILPDSRRLSPTPPIGRWYSSSPVIVGGTEIGRINARRVSAGVIEFGFTPTGGKRILPRPNRFSFITATTGRWYRSGEITIEENDDGADQPPLRTTQDPTTISAGYHHTCALRESGAIECWGANNYGQTDAPAGSFRAVSAGGWHSCGLRTNGEIECWGANGYGQRESRRRSYSAVSTGGWHTCGLRSTGAIECWGANDYGQTDAPQGSYSAVSAGTTHTCGLNTTGEIKCWGGSRKQPSYEDADYGQTNAPSGSFRAVSAGGYHTCGLRESGAIECWGDNSSGQTDARRGSYTAVSAGNEYTCGLDTTIGVISCWGQNNYGQAVFRTRTGRFTAVSAGGAHTCGLRTDREIECWGFNNSGQATSPTEPLDRQIAERFAPVLRFAAGEQYFPVPVELMIQHSTLHYTRNGQARTKAPGTYRLTDLISHNGQDSYLDLADGQRRATGERVVYARVAEIFSGRTDGVLVQYWFFYLYNATGEPTHSHEGDWEGIQLWFAGLSREDLLTANVPTQLGYAAHESGWAYTKNRESCAEIVSPHQPSVYVARNRHASYIRAGSGGHLDKSFSGWARDQFQGNGATWVLQGRDLPNVGGELGYAIRMLPTDLNQSWLAWNGRWGDTSGNGGPIGPAFKLHFRHSPATVAESKGWSTDEFTCRPRVDAPPSSPTGSAGDEHATGSAGDERATGSADGEDATDSADDERATGSTDDDPPATDSADGERATSDSREFTAVSAGGGRTCGLHSTGEILCWGYDAQTAPPGPFTAVSVGASHTCAIRESGAIECWGGNYFGQSAPPEGSFTAVSAGGRQTCAIHAGTGAIECWGQDWWRRGNAREGSFTAVSTGAAYICAIREIGWIECWGSKRGKSHRPAGWFSAVSAGGARSHNVSFSEHACAIRESGAIECWGDNEYGQTDAPQGSFTAVSAGSYNTCAIRESGAIECWGDNRSGQSDAPEGSFTAVSAGGGHTCAIRESGAIECWGGNEHGQAESPNR